MDVALELVGLPLTMRQAVQSLAILGRAALVGLTNEKFQVAPYAELLNREAEIIGVSDHFASEIPLLLDLAAGASWTSPTGSSAPFRWRPTPLTKPWIASKNSATMCAW